MIKITNLELENIKRIKAVQLAPSESEKLTAVLKENSKKVQI